MKRPPCYNRPPFAAGYWARNGRRAGKPRYRWVAHRLSTGCQSQEQVEYLGHDCRGCRWAS